MTETMGTINDRTHEHLGTTDQFIIRTPPHASGRSSAQEQGIIPPGVDKPEVYRQRSGEIILPRTQDWWQSYLNTRAQMTPLETLVETR